MFTINIEFPDTIYSQRKKLAGLQYTTVCNTCTGVDNGF